MPLYPVACPIYLPSFSSLLPCISCFLIRAFSKASSTAYIMALLVIVAPVLASTCGVCFCSILSITVFATFQYSGSSCCFTSIFTIFPSFISTSTSTSLLYPFAFPVYFPSLYFLSCVVCCSTIFPSFISTSFPCRYIFISLLLFVIFSILVFVSSIFPCVSLFIISSFIWLSFICMFPVSSVTLFAFPKLYCPWKLIVLLFCLYASSSVIASALFIALFGFILP